MNLALGVEDVDRGNVPVVGGQAGQHPPDSRDSERVRPLSPRG
jgi:ribosome biogenesis SPOUT family RNA methylase Rps3